MTNAVYLGDVKHRRFAVKHHAFNYPLYMMWVDLNNIEALNGVHKQLGTTGFKALKSFLMSRFLIEYVSFFFTVLQSLKSM